MENRMEYNFSSPMASNQPFLAAPSRISIENSKSKNSISIMKSRQLIADLENTLAKDQPGTVTAIDRQVNSSMVVDFKTFAPDGNGLHHLIARDGDSSEGAFFSYLILEKEEDIPSKVIYRWIKKLPFQGRTKSVVLKEEEHIYTGQMRNNRKHGEGEYIVLRKWSDSTETRLRYCGVWSADVFSSGTFENESGELRQINHTTFATFKSRSNVKAKKTEKNLTIKVMTQEMKKKKSVKDVNKERESNVSCASILNKLKAERVDSSLHTIRLI